MPFLSTFARRWQKIFWKATWHNCSSFAENETRPLRYSQLNRLESYISLLRCNCLPGLLSYRTQIECPIQQKNWLSGTKILNTVRWSTWILILIHNYWINLFFYFSKTPLGTWKFWTWWRYWLSENLNAQSTCHMKSFCPLRKQFSDHWPVK